MNTTTAERPTAPAQHVADAPQPPAPPVYTWQCRACPTSTPDYVAAAVHSLQPGHVTDYAPAGMIAP